MVNLKILRDQMGISQAELADRIGISQQSVAKYENMKAEPDFRTLKLLADIFNTSIDYLIGYTEIEHKIETVQPFELNQEEARFLLTYRRLSGYQRELLGKTADEFVKAK